MADVTITVTHNTPEIIRQLDGAPRRVLESVDRSMATGAAHVTRRARERAPKAETELTNAIQQRRVSLLEHHIEAAKDYASFQEDGTKAGGWPTLDRTLKWMARKGITPRDPDMSLEDVAHLIRRKIVRHGVPKQPYMEPALRENLPMLDRLYRAGVVRGLAAVERGRAL